MIDIAALDDQLKCAGCNFRFWGRSELRELRQILLDNEVIKFAVNGRYTAGFALLCVTNQRLLLIDHKPMYLSLEDIRFDMISEVDYNYRLLNATVQVFTPNKLLSFTSWTKPKLRELTNYTQLRVMEIRQYYINQQSQAERITAVSDQQPRFIPNLALQTNTRTLKHAGRLSVRLAAAAVARIPMHNSYAQLPLTSRNISRQGIFSRIAGN
jgi:hypothetical protein